jgi:hypothetical protein
MIEDEVMRQVRAAKEAFAASHGYDMRRMHEALRKMDEESGVPTVRLELRKPEVQVPMAPSSIEMPTSTAVPSV